MYIVWEDGGHGRRRKRKGNGDGGTCTGNCDTNTQTVTQIHKLISVHTRDYHVFWPSNEGSVPAESESLISDIHLEAS